jgi:hypothetical protein
MSNEKSIPKWTEERTQHLVAIVGDGSPVTLEVVADAAQELDTTERSVASKLRKMGYEVEKAGAPASRFTPEQGDILRAFVTGNSGQFTYSQIAEAFEDGEFTSKEIQGKILSMELTSHVRPTPKAEVVKSSATHEEIQTLMLSKVRQDMANKTKVKDILAQYKAAKVTDLSEKDLQTVFDAVSAL